MPTFDLAHDNTALLVIDMQERFLPVIPAIAGDQACGRNCRILLAAAALLHVPSVISEQYPKGLGATMPGLVETNPQAARFAKTHFSCCDDPELANHLAHLNREYVVVCGIEAHVCVLATVADLLRRGQEVVVAGDAVASRHPGDCELALPAMRDLGALVAPTEAIVFRLQRQAGVGQFKALSALVK